MYKIDEADLADQARSAAFNRLVTTPGAATYYALLRLQKEVTCRIPAARLKVFAEERGINDSESAPWPPNEALVFEQHHEVAPRTAKDLRTVLVHRVEDMKHDLPHGDFSQGRTVKTLGKEVDVQNSIAERLRLKQGRSF